MTGADRPDRADDGGSDWIGLRPGQDHRRGVVIVAVLVTSAAIWLYGR